jgi:sigma-B regulation protein RsbU (phosphoserine phosphatase)
VDLSPHRSHSLLAEIPLPLLQDMVCRCAHASLAPGDVLLTPGEENHTLYFVLSGRLRLHLDARDSPNNIPIAEGEIVGEMSIIEKRLVSAWVIADQPSFLLAMPEGIFWDEFVTVPEANRRLMQFLIARVRGTDALLQRELERKVRYELLKRELESAWKIQANLLPSASPLFRSPAIDVHAFIRPAREVGGDFYDAVALDETHLCVAIGDVSGKGMPAALFMMRAVTLLRSALLERRDPVSVLPALNQQLCEANEEFMFVTLAVALIDTATGYLTYLNAGHNPPVLSIAGGPFRTWEPPKGALLGVVPKASYEVRELVLGRGDTLLFYTDGVTEAENANHEVFGVVRLTGCLDTGGPFNRVAAIVEQVDSAVTAFVAGAQQSDDITMLALRFVGVR